MSHVHEYSHCDDKGVVWHINVDCDCDVPPGAMKLPSPFKIPKDIGPRLTSAEVAKKYGLTKISRRRRRTMATKTRNKPGRLSVRWTRKRDDVGPGTIGARLGYLDHGDLSFGWGEGCRKSDGSLLNSVFAWTPPLGAGAPERTLAEELHARGYDLATLKFSIDKRAQETPSQNAEASSVTSPASVGAHTSSSSSTKAEGQ